MTVHSRNYLLQILLMSQCSFYFLNTSNQSIISMQLLATVHNIKQSHMTSKTTFINQFSGEFDKSKNNKYSVVDCSCHYNVFFPVFDEANIFSHYLYTANFYSPAIAKLPCILFKIIDKIYKLMISLFLDKNC